MFSPKPTKPTFKCYLPPVQVCIYLSLMVLFIKMCFGGFAEDKFLLNEWDVMQNLYENSLRMAPFLR